MSHQPRQTRQTLCVSDGIYRSLRCHGESARRPRSIPSQGCFSDVADTNASNLPLQGFDRRISLLHFHLTYICVCVQYVQQSAATLNVTDSALERACVLHCSSFCIHSASLKCESFPPSCARRSDSSFSPSFSSPFHVSLALPVNTWWADRPGWHGAPCIKGGSRLSSKKKKKSANPATKHVEAARKLLITRRLLLTDKGHTREYNN